MPEWLTQTDETEQLSYCDGYDLVRYKHATLGYITQAACKCPESHPHRYQLYRDRPHDSWKPVHWNENLPSKAQTIAALKKAGHEIIYPATEPNTQTAP